MANSYERELLAFKKLKSQRDLLNFTFSQLIDFELFQDRWAQIAKARSELQLLLDLIETDLKTTQAS